MNAKSSLRILSVVGFLFLVAPFYRQCVGVKMEEAPAEEAPVTGEVVPQGTDSIAFAKRNDLIQKEMVLQFEKDSVAAIKTQDSIEKFTPSYQKIYQKIDDETNENAFEMAYQFFDFSKVIFSDPQRYWKEFHERKHETKATYIARPIWLGCFLFIVLFTLISLIASFTKKTRMVLQMAKWNIILLFLALGCIFLDCWFEEITQVKWGYYAFTMVQIAIALVSQKLLNESESNE